MRNAMVLYLANMALAQGSSSSVDATNSLAAPTIETNSVGVPTGVASSITSSTALVNGTTVLPTPVSNGTAPTGTNGTGVVGGSQPTVSGSAGVSGGSTGAAAVMKPMAGFGAAGVVLAWLL